MRNPKPFYIIAPDGGVTGSRFVYEPQGSSDTAITIPAISTPVGSDVFFKFITPTVAPGANTGLIDSSSSFNRINLFVDMSGDYILTGCRAFVDGSEVVTSDPMPLDGLNHVARLISTEPLGDIGRINSRFDGTGVYVDSIYDVDIRSYPVFSFSTFDFDISAEIASPRGIEYVSDNSWVVDSATAAVYKYTSGGVYTGEFFSVSNQDSSPAGITFDGEFFWVLGRTSKKVYKYTESGVFTGIKFDVDFEDGLPEGVAWDGEFFWMVGLATGFAYKYTAQGVYTGTSFSTSGEDSALREILFADEFLWVVSDASSVIYKYTDTGIYTGISFSTTTEDSIPLGIAWTGTALLVSGGATQMVYEYTSDPVVRRFYAINDVSATLKDSQSGQDGTVSNHDITRWVKLAR